MTSLAGPVGFTLTQPYVIIRHLRFVSKGNAATVSLWVGATGANAAGTEVFAQGLAIAANTVLDVYDAFRMDAADFLVGGASVGTTITMHGAGEIGFS